MDEMRPSGGAGAMGLASLFPPGLQAIYGECRRLYPEQPNPLQVTAIVKYWLGGPDPLDYISMYRCVGSAAQHVPEHWHYVSFGLSDLYGDNRVHEFTGQDGPSGFGFELTFRLKREAGETAPPTWPAELMQGLARYVFQSENTFCSGDHVSWHSPLDNSESRIQHMLLTEDPQLQPVQTPFGLLTFLQQERVDKGIETDGSNLSGVSAKCAWEDLSRPPDDEDDSRSICVGSQPRRLSDKVSFLFHCIGAVKTVWKVKALHGPWLQILLTEEFVERMLEDLEDLTAREVPKLPREYSWPEKKLKISILPDSVFDSPLQ
ncbi:UNVERIFIED_CONTAM: hypothetical protein FKN15_070028 [Acipenser sinensis]